MADEITVNCRLQVTKDASNIDDPPILSPPDKIDWSGTERLDMIVKVGTSEEALPMTDITTPGWCYAENLDTTNYVSIRSATGVAACLELKPGEGYPFRLARTATAPFAIANTAEVRMRWVVYED